MQKDSMKSVRNVMILGSTVLMLLFSVVLTSIGVFTTSNVVSNNIKVQLDSAAQMGIDSIDAWLYSNIAKVEEIADSTEIKSLSSSFISPYLKEKLERSETFSSFWFSDLEGNWYSPLGTSGSIAQRAYFPEVLRQKKTVISDPLIGQADGQLAVVLAVPVFVDGEMRAILGANLKVTELIEYVNEISVGESGHITLYTSDGLTVIDRDASLTLKYNPFDDPDNMLSKYKSQILGGRQDMYAGTQNGEDIYAYNADLRLTDWKMVAIAKKSEFVAPLYNALMWNVIGTIVFLVIAFFVVYAFASKIAHPLQTFNSIIGRMSRGDMTSGSESIGRGAISDIVRALDEVREKLRLIVVKARTSVDAVVSDSKKITAETKTVTGLAHDTAAGSREIMDNSRKDAGSADMIASAVSNISDSITKVDDGMRSIADSADTTVRLADNGNRDITSVIDQMGKIRTAVDSAASVISKVEASSRRIGEIVTTIANISKQTNLLAVNASIEAARAGEQGKGFAVVAGEVGKLASQTNEATSQISSLAEEMLEHANDAISSIESGTHEVSVGTDVVQSAGRTFGEIQTLINSLLSQLNEIKEDVGVIASKRQDLIMAANGIESSVHKTSSRSESATAAMEEQLDLVSEMERDVANMSRMAETLLEDISIFKV